MGHVLGIVDHSPHREDKMWVSGNFSAQTEDRDPSTLLTVRDVNTLEEAYCRP
jgi:predicted Zn-dependent protease